MSEKEKKNRTAIKIVCIVCLSLIVLLGAFTVVSHALYHRSNMATAAELLFRIQRSKRTFSAPKKVAQYIAKRADAKDYALDTAKIKSSVTEERVSGSRVYTLTSSSKPDYLVLYLHGGAYINDALL